jgi:hypothetical protein
MAASEPSSPSLVPCRRAGRHADRRGSRAEPFAIGAFDADQVIGSGARARPVRTARARPGADRGGPHRARSCRVDLSHRRGSDRHACATPGRRGGRFRVGALATLSRNFQMEFLEPLIGRADVELVLRSGAPGGPSAGPGGAGARCRPDEPRSRRAIRPAPIWCTTCPNSRSALSVRRRRPASLVDRLSSSSVPNRWCCRRRNRPCEHPSTHLSNGSGWCPRLPPRRTTWRCCAF